jgi:hypothetical protein
MAEKWSTFKASANPAPVYRRLAKLPERWVSKKHSSRRVLAIGLSWRAVKSCADKVLVFQTLTVWRAGRKRRAIELGEANGVKMVESKANNAV